MADLKQKTTGAKRSTLNKTRAKAEQEEKRAVAADPSPASAEAAENEPVKVKHAPRKPEFTPETFVTVRNGFNGKLVYRSRRTGEMYIWQELGDEQEMELQELRNARSSSKAFYENNWFVFDDPDVPRWLGVDRYYANAISPEGLEEIISSTPEEIEERISRLSESQKKTLTYSAQKLVADGKIDSVRALRALESGLGISLSD